MVWPRVDSVPDYTDLVRAGRGEVTRSNRMSGEPTEGARARGAGRAFLRRYADVDVQCFSGTRLHWCYPIPSALRTPAP
jgi:hypothetical protein